MMLHDTIKRIRESRQMTQEEVAERLNLAVRSYMRIESGETRLDWDRIRAIAGVYEMSPEELVAYDNGAIIQTVNNNDESASSGPAYNNCSFYGAEKELYDQLIAQLREEIARMREDMAFLREELIRSRRES